MFLHTVGYNIGNRVIGASFGRSGEVVSRYFQRVFHAIGELRDDLIRKPSLETQTKTEGNYRWDLYFKDYIGAIDGKHVRASITPDMQPKQ
uniref:DDE Tnp4 domain-containing protein n=1 Tax=Triticum urartu TaxID=4572 RepID=A0A8R7JYK2_TRIUA